MQQRDPGHTRPGTPPRISRSRANGDSWRGPKEDHDMLQPELYGALCTAAKQGRVVFIGGGPNCRTWSILRHIPKSGAPTPVRGRTPETLWGLPHLDQAAQTQLDDDSILILRQMYITSLARASRAAVSLPGPRSFLEHPQDPVVSSSLPKAKECSSFCLHAIHWLRTAADHPHLLRAPSWRALPPGAGALIGAGGWPGRLSFREGATP